MTDLIEFDHSKPMLEQNALTYRNIISPFANVQSIDPQHTTGKTYVDSNYGYVYDDYYLKDDAAIYGPTGSLPTFSGDHLANHGFLRVPFRKIPRVLIKTRQELLNILSSIQSRDPNLVVLYRGQFSEYYIQRDDQTKSMLYGATDILEPSLVTSAARKNVSLDSILPSWMAILNIYLKREMDEVPAYDHERIARKMRIFQSNSNFHGFALAMAQHYGLPSVGLDVSPNIDIALFFALRKFTATGVSGKYNYIDYREVKPTNPSVIYLLAPAEAQQLNFFAIRPPVSRFLRPDAQVARFMHTGWGLSKNFAATRIFLAIYLDPKGDYGTIKSPAELFPQDDEFAQLIHKFKTDPRHKNPELEKFLDSFYVVE